MNSAVLTASLTGRIQFLLRCVATTNLTNCYCGSCVSIPPCALLQPRLASASGHEPESERGYEPPGAFAPLHDQLRLLRLPVRSGRPRADGGADLRAALPNSRAPTPPARPPHRWLATDASRTVSVVFVLQPACQASRFPRQPTACGVRALAVTTYRCRAGRCEALVQKLGRGGVTAPR